MKKPTLGIYQFIRNGIKYDYPFQESLRSALEIADEVVVCECESDDKTLEVLLDLQKESNNKLKIVSQPWVLHYTDLCILGNYAATFLSTDWKWQLQGDEILHESDYSLIKSKIEEAAANSRINALTTKYYHFLANYNTLFPFMYNEIIRIYRSGSNWRLVDDACRLDGGSADEVLFTDIKVYHYGKVKEGHIGFQKEIDFQNLYTEIGFPDPKMAIMKDKLGEEFCDYLFLFEKAIKEGKISKFERTHPKVMKDRIKKFEDEGWEQFLSKIIEGLKI
jgi:glycosyltransferase involved in cell wall biosynthesis